jgi:uncharacterized protein (DUF2062 family)
MMNEIEIEEVSEKRHKLLMQMAVGFVLGGLSGAGAVYLVGALGVLGSLRDTPLSVTVATIVGAVYLVMAAVVLFGTLNSKLGAKLLQVEDEDEIHEQKRLMVDSGIAMTLWGAALIALAVAAPVGPLAAPVALAIGAGGLVGGSWFAWRTYRAADELMLAMNLEAGALTYALVLLVLGSWGMLAHLDYVAGPQPLDILTACYVLVMMATFFVAGRRGMLEPR